MKRLLCFLVFLGVTQGCMIESTLTSQEFYNQTQFFFVGRVVGVKKIPVTSLLPSREETTFRVVDVLKGEIIPFVRIYTADRDGGCGEWDAKFSKGRLYFIGAYLQNGSRYFGKEGLKFSILRPNQFIDREIGETNKPYNGSEFRKLYFDLGYGPSNPIK